MQKSQKLSRLLGDLQIISVTTQNNRNSQAMKKPLQLLIGVIVFSGLALICSAFKNLPTLIQGRKIENTSYGLGEVLRYRIHYGPINAGIVTMSVLPNTHTINGKTAYNLRVEGETLKSFDWAYKVRDKFESWVDQESQAPLRYAKTVRENTYFNQDVAIYDHEKATLRNKQGELEIPRYTQDIASAIYYLRNLDYSSANIGKRFPIDIYLDNQVYNLNITFIGKETIKTDIGKVRCIKIKPKLVVDRVFKNTDGMTVWVSDDENHVPLRIKTEIQVGSLTVDLITYDNVKNPFNALIK
ncbi:MAG: hypothetical protein CK532_07240 [Flavobacteriales bacterium]|nr:MAG: hypothetical protein CK532_07240 [Flavobacteriales bacterium]